MAEKEERILFTDVLSCPEAAQAWGITEDKIKRYAREGRFLSSEARQTGKYWIITKQGMRRLFGNAPAPRILSPSFSKSSTS